MDAVTYGPLVARLKRSEGFRAQVYVDTTGHLTIGYGHNLGRIVLEGVPQGVRVKVKIHPVNGLTQSIAEMLLLGILDDVIARLSAALPWFDSVDPVRKEVLADMAYNMGTPKLIEGWPNFLNDVRYARFAKAADTMRGSLWRAQVGDRAVKLADMMQYGRRE